MNFAEQNERRRLESIAATFKPNAMYERLIADPALLARFSPTTRIELGQYQAAKAAYEQVQAQKEPQA